MAAYPITDEIRNADGSLPQYTSVGSYTIVYLTKCDEVLCAACASKDRSNDFPGPAVWYGEHAEGDPLECIDCGRDIESSYGPVDD